jgi:hypothetical protein
MPPAFDKERLKELVYVLPGSAQDKIQFLQVRDVFDLCLQL